MAWKIELSAQVDRELGKLDPQQSKRILKFLHERVARLDNPRSIGQALQGSKLGGILEIPRRRLSPNLQDRRQPAPHFGSPRRPSPGNLPMTYLCVPALGLNAAGFDFSPAISLPHHPRFFQFSIDKR